MRLVVAWSWVLAAACGRIHFDAVGEGAAADAAREDGDTSLPITSNIAFVTSTTVVPGELGALAGADAACMARAAAAGLPGIYVAWLSTATVRAPNRLAGARGWQRVDGRPVVDTVEDLVAGRLFHPLEIDELGNRMPVGTHVMTNTFADGMPAGFDCGGFTSTSGAEWGGRTHQTTVFWTSTGGSQGCGTPQHIYCFGIDSSAAVTPPPVTTRRAFQPTTSWKPGSGIADADLHCQQAADAAALGGTFRALLATSTASAISRFDLAGTNWVRLDGVALASSPAALAAGRTDAPLNVTEQRVYLPPDGSVWTGATSPESIGDLTCGDWVDATGAVTARTGSPVSAGSTAFDSGTNPCNSTTTWLYCFEQ